MSVCVTCQCPVIKGRLNQILHVETAPGGATDNADNTHRTVYMMLETEVEVALVLEQGTEHPSRLF